MPDEQGPKPPERRVTSPARRHRIPLRFRDRLEKRPLRTNDSLG
jgi:hypothetical protein